MLGAIFGDIVGSVYEFHNTKKYGFVLLREESGPTDDSCMTLAVAKSFTETWGKEDDVIRAALVKNMREIGRRYPGAGYGGRFYHWLFGDDPKPYGSYGNGSGMRVSPVGWMFDTLEDTLHAAKLSAEVTHNHPEGIMGAEAVAAAIYLARTGKTKEEIKQFITGKFGYDLNRTLDEIRPDYTFTEICRTTVPESIIAFLESNGFEDAIRKAVSLGGDSDTIACMTGAIAEAYYGMPEKFKQEVHKRLDAYQWNIVKNYQKFLKNKKTDS